MLTHINYFVGYGAFVANSWMVRPYRARNPKKGDVVFLISWAEAGPVLVGVFTIGELVEYEAAIGVVPKLLVVLPKLSVPSNLFPELELKGGEEKDGRWLHLIDEDTSRVLQRISQEYLDSADSPLSFGKKRTREKKEKRQKTAEEFFETIEKSANKRIGQGKFRDDLVRVYAGRCAITECPIDEVLSAAHIWDYSLSECQDVWNGILLRADIHLLFDRHLLRIFPGDPPLVMLDPDLQKSELYKNLNRHPMRLPKPFDPRTNAELLRRWDAANKMCRPFPDPKG
jgi:hypothetical protein